MKHRKCKRSDKLHLIGYEETECLHSLFSLHGKLYAFNSDDDSNPTAGEAILTCSFLISSGPP